MDSVFWIKVKQFFGGQLTAQEQLLLKEGPVLVATPKSASTPTAPSPLPNSPAGAQPLPSVSPSSPPAVGKPSTPNPALLPPANTPTSLGTVTSPVSLPPALTRLDKAERYTLENEDGVRWDHDDGEFTNDARDPGGATMWGVIKTEYEDYLGRPLSVDEVKTMPRSTALAILVKKFYAPAKCGVYTSDAAAMAIFDTGVNKGLGGLKIILQDACHTNLSGEAWEYKQDAIDAVNGMHEQEFVDNMTRATLNYIDARISRYPNMEWARRGWTARAKRMMSLVGWSPEV